MGHNLCRNRVDDRDRTFPGVGHPEKTADKAFDERRHTLGIDLRDTQAKTDGRIGRRTASLAQDPFSSRKRDDVIDRQEVGLVFEIADEFELVLHQHLNFFRHARGPAFAHAFCGQFREIARRRLPARHDLVRVLVTDLIK